MPFTMGGRAAFGFFRFGPEDFQHRTGGFHRREAPLRELLREMENFGSGAGSDTEHVHGRRKPRKHRIAEQVQRAVDRCQSAPLPIVGRCLLIKKGRNFVFVHGAMGALLPGVMTAW